ncbi:MAG: ribose 5-phosphate isomerase B [Tissierellia bacterium]|nr:ribose 5-phosphate isomerase B [Tissierellia bacterium]
MIIGLGSDHGGFALKEELKKYVEELGYDVKDYGTHSTDSVDYPEFGKAVGQGVVKGEVDFGIVCCGSGIGISIAANKVKGIRCAQVWEPYGAKMCRRHNNANMISLGGRMVGLDMAKECVRAFLTTDFEGGRHERRVAKLEG